MHKSLGEFHFSFLSVLPLSGVPFSPPAAPLPRELSPASLPLRASGRRGSGRCAELGRRRRRLRLPSPWATSGGAQARVHGRSRGAAARRGPARGQRGPAREGPGGSPAPSLRSGRAGGAGAEPGARGAGACKCGSRRWPGAGGRGGRGPGAGRPRPSRRQRGRLWRGELGRRSCEAEAVAGRDELRGAAVQPGTMSSLHPCGGQGRNSAAQDRRAARLDFRRRVRVRGSKPRASRLGAVVAGAEREWRTGGAARRGGPAGGYAGVPAVFQQHTRVSRGSSAREQEDPVIRGGVGIANQSGSIVSSHESTTSSSSYSSPIARARPQTPRGSSWTPLPPYRASSTPCTLEYRRCGQS
jgi:hypothetical protein